MDYKVYVISRLIAYYLWPEVMDKGKDIHHVDLNRLNNSVSNLQIMSHAEHTGFHHKGYKSAPLSQDKKNVILFYQKGQTLKEIANKYHCAECTMHRRLQEWGVPRRRSGPRGTA